VTVLASVAGRRGTTAAVTWSNHTKLGLSGLAGQGCGLAFGARGGLLGRGCGGWRTGRSARWWRVVPLGNSVSWC